MRLVSIAIAAALTLTGATLVQGAGRGGYAPTTQDEIFNGYHRQAVALLEKGRLREGIVYLNAALRVRPRSGSELYNRGKALHLAGRFEGAVADFSAVLDLQLHFVPALMNRGASRANLGRFDAAVADLTEAHRHAPGNADCLFNRGTIFLMQQQAEQAAADLSAAIALNSATAPIFRTGDAPFRCSVGTRRRGPTTSVRCHSIPMTLRAALSSTRLDLSRGVSVMT